MTQRLSLLVVFFCTMPVFAQQSTGTTPSDQPDNAALLQKIRDLEDRVIAMEGQIRQLKSQQAPASAATSPPAAGPAAKPAATPEGGTTAVAAGTQTQQLPAPGSVPSAGEGVTQSVALGGAGGSAA